jgi:nucleotide-binding universal stress UspA family protein
MKMLIAVDGSDHARHALEAAAKLAAQLPQTEVVLLNVVEALVYYGEPPPFDHEAIERAQRAHQQQLLAAAAEHARACGLPAPSLRAEVGLPANEIVRVADELGVDQIVMGTHGKGSLGSLFLGSVAQRVLHLTQRPVLLVK